MKQLFTLMALLLTSVTFGQETCNNVFDYNDNNTIDIEDFLAILGLFADVDLDDDGTWDSLDNCLDLSACNYASELNEPCTYLPLGDCDCNGNVLDECGVCGGTGLAPGTCDCGGTLIDVIGVCGGDCWADEDADGICDDVDECVGEYDACDVCNGPGAIYECGCANIPEGECDCDGNVLDAIGVCGGACSADEDADGVCDDVDDCVGEFDVCGVCNGPGEVYECGCSDVPEGECDCEGNVLDALGECGGECLADEDGDGVCDDVDDCVGQFDECGVCNGDGAVYECGCNDIPEGDCDCDGNVLDECGVCNGPGPTEIVIEDIVTYYDSVYLPFDDAWYVYPVDADTTFGFTCAPSFQGCGDPVSYQGYDYATVQIGDQCWFAENLRNEQYANGDSIPSDLSEELWSTTSSGAVAIYGDEAGYCDHYSLVFNACDELQALEEYGRLYNWFAVVDARNLCPSGWHVSTDEDWTDLEIALGMNETEVNNSGWRGTTEGSHLKATYGWDGGCNGPSFDHECNGGGNGTNSTGFSALPGGRRGPGIQPYDFAGGNGMWWSPASSNNYEAFYRMMDYGDNIYRSSPPPTWGYSVRCIQDTPEVLGCVDASACNYDELANEDDGSCNYVSCAGCTDNTACNFDPGATIVDGSCDYSCWDLGLIPGCMIPNACNYDPWAEYCPSGNCCILPAPGYCDCQGNVPDALGECGGNCLDIPEGDCDCNGNVLDAIGTCGGQCTADEDSDGICDDEDWCIGTWDSCGVCNGDNSSCLGCTIGCASNYNPAATYDDGSCYFEGCCDPNSPEYAWCDPNIPCYDDGSCWYWPEGCTDSSACNWDSAAIEDDGSCEYESCAPVLHPCGDPVSYQGYEYATVQIGEQCWFAENLRSENYENGDGILSGLSDSLWMSTSTGAFAVYGEGSVCAHSSPDGDACDEEWSQTSFGHLYNWYAVSDLRNLCPIGWHVPTHDEWTVMTNGLGSQVVAGVSMKTTYGWADNLNGNNSSGFSGLPGGFRLQFGNFYGAGITGQWWAYSEDNGTTRSWAVGDTAMPWLEYVYEMSNYPKNEGRSVRCIQNTEE